MDRGLHIGWIEVYSKSRQGSTHWTDRSLLKEWTGVYTLDVERGISLVECWTRNKVSPGSNPNEYLAIDSGGNVSDLVVSPEKSRPTSSVSDNPMGGNTLYGLPRGVGGFPCGT